MNEFETISYDQACGMIRRHVNKPVTVVTAPFPGMSMQVAGQLYVQEEGEHFAFAIDGGTGVSISVVPFAEFMFQIPKGSETPDALVCAMEGQDPGQEMLVWMLRF